MEDCSPSPKELGIGVAGVEIAAIRKREAVQVVENSDEEKSEKIELLQIAQLTA